MQAIYAHRLRPVSVATLPEGVSWEFVCAPHDLAGARPDLPVDWSRRYGTYRTSRPITDAECAQFDIDIIAKESATAARQDRLHRDHPDGDFDTPEDADAFRQGLCPECLGFGHYYERDEDDAPTKCAACKGTGTITPL